MNNDTNIGLVLAAALRYSLGRRSYIVPTIQDFIRRYKNNNIIDLCKFNIYFFVSSS